ncbi:SGNH hydrolase [Hymenopellis radicata]|nr:SGNH hydrolase [Hymenopellis radicata]
MAVIFGLLAWFFVSVAASKDRRPSVPTSFVLIGDSTTANGQVNYFSWRLGERILWFHRNIHASSLEPDTPCINTAHNGATTGTFVANGFWNISVAAIQAEVAKGRRTFATIQFGHNDMKIAPPASMGANMTIMVQEIRALGAEPILPWADEAILVAQEQGTHLLDLHAASIAYCEAIGEDASHRLNRLEDDNTHLNVNGTIVFGRMVADLMEASFPPGDLPIIANPGLTFNITHGIASY